MHLKFTYTEGGTVLFQVFNLFLQLPYPLPGIDLPPEWLNRHSALTSTDLPGDPGWRVVLVAVNVSPAKGLSAGTWGRGTVLHPP